MKKALLVTRVSGFIPQHEMNNVRLLQQMGYEVHYATNLNVVVYGKDNSRLEGTGIVTHQIDFCRSPFSRQVLVAFEQLKNLMLEEEFDLVHCHMPMSGVLARMAAQSVRRFTGRQVPVLYTAHGFHFCQGESLKNWLYYPVERRMARYTDVLITMNKEDFERAGKFPVRGRVEKINGVGISMERFTPWQKSTWEAERAEGEADIRRRYQIPDDYYIMVSVGELSARKNHMVILETLSELKDLKLVCIICGEGQKKEALKARAKELGIENQVIFAGYVENTMEVLKQSDCFIFPSLREGLPVAVMEAMAVGLPVIASDIRGVRDLIRHTSGGYLVKGFAPEDYAVKVRRLFTEKEGKSAVPRKLRRQQMGEWNRRRVQEFSSEVTKKQMQEIYQSL